MDVPRKTHVVEVAEIHFEDPQVCPTVKPVTGSSLMGILRGRPSYMTTLEGIILIQPTNLRH
jgi:hypothetical protein